MAYFFLNSKPFFLYGDKITVFPIIQLLLYHHIIVNSEFIQLVWNKPWIGIAAKYLAELTLFNMFPLNISTS